MTTTTITHLTAPNQGPLRGTRILDLTRLAPGPYCAMLLADLGAEVLRIDAPTPPARTYAMLARNKRSIVLDLKTTAGRQVLHTLVKTADVFLEGNRPGVMQRLEADYETLSKINPNIIYCSLTGFGQEGPLAQAAGHDINYIALSGVLSQMQKGERGIAPPLNLVADYGGGGMLAAFGITAALFERERSGQGQFIDAAMVDGSASIMAAHYSAFQSPSVPTGDTASELSQTDQVTGMGVLSRPGKGLLGGGAPFYRCYQCSDGRWMAVGAIERNFFNALCEATDLPFSDQQMDESQWPEQHTAFEAIFRTDTRAHWTKVFEQFDACTSPVLDLDEAPDHPHNIARGTFLIGPDDQLHVARAPRFSRTPASIRSRPPKSGEHTVAVLLETGFEQSEIDDLAERGAFGSVQPNTP